MSQLSICSQAETLANFPAAVPGFLQLRPLQLTGSLEVSFMFRTGQSRALLLYVVDPNRFYYVSLCLVDGALVLRVFPNYEIDTSLRSGGPGGPGDGDKADSSPEGGYNDNEWHTVSVFVSETDIQLHVDDHDYFRYIRLSPVIMTSAVLVLLAGPFLRIGVTRISGLPAGMPPSPSAPPEVK